MTKYQNALNILITEIKNPENPLEVNKAIETLRQLEAKYNMAKSKLDVYEKSVELLKM